MAEYGEAVHRETWTLVITRADGDDWPDRPRPYGARGNYHIEKIRLSLTRGRKRPDVSLSGYVPKADGTPGARRASESFDFGPPPPAWVTELVRLARTARELTPDRTGVPW